MAARSSANGRPLGVSGNRVARGVRGVASLGRASRRDHEPRRSGRDRRPNHALVLRLPLLVRRSLRRCRHSPSRFGVGQPGAGTRSEPQRRPPHPSRRLLRGRRQATADRVGGGDRIGHRAAGAPLGQVRRGGPGGRLEPAAGDLRAPPRVGDPAGDDPSGPEHPFPSRGWEAVDRGVGRRPSRSGPAGTSRAARPGGPGAPGPGPTTAGGGRSLARRDAAGRTRSAPASRACDRRSARRAPRSGPPNG